MKNSFFGRRGWTAAAVAASALLAGCASLGLDNAAQTFRSGKEAAKTGTEIYRGKYSFVRLEAAEPGAAPNQAQPLEAAQLRSALAGLKGKQNSFAGKPLFTARELAELVPPLTTALGKAGPGEDVVFAVTGVHSGQGLLLQSQSVTTGRAFIREGRLNVIFGLAQVNFEDELLGNHTLRPFTPGSRLKAVNADSRIEGLGWVPGADGRQDWLAISLASLSAQAGAKAARTEKTEESVEMERAAAVEHRLEVLERLKQRGLITDEEYRDKRRVILMDL